MGEDIGTTSFTPTKKIVIVKPVMRARGMIKDPKHEAFFLFGNSTIDLSLPMDSNNNLINPFTNKAEQAWLEKELDADLNIYKRKDNFWLKHKVRLGKDSRKLDLSNAKDYLDYLVLRSNKLYIAPSGDTMDKKATYKYALVTEDFETKVKVSSADKKKKAYKESAKLETQGRDAMLNFLKVYGKRMSPDSKIDFLIAQVDQVIEDDIDGFLEIVSDDGYDIKLLITEAIEIGAVTKKGKQYFLPGGDKLCGEGEFSSMDIVIKYLRNPVHAEILSSLYAKIKAKK